MLLEVWSAARSVVYCSLVISIYQERGLPSLSRISMSKNAAQAALSVQTLTAGFLFIAVPDTRRREGMSMAIERGIRRPGPADVLTAREQEVLKLLTCGITSDRELCERLHITQNTVKYHIRNILSKLGRRNRAQLVAYALGHQLADVPSAGADGLLLGDASRGTTTTIHASAALRARPRILVADDDEPMLDLMTVLLGDQGEYEVLTHRLDGDTHDHVGRELPDLVILDLLDGGRQEMGWHALELLRLDPATSRIPVILCSAATDRLARHRDRIDELGVGVLAKPFDIDDLLQKVSDALSVQQVEATFHGHLIQTGTTIASNETSHCVTAGTKGS